jgi:hypothetical protein
MGRQSSRWQKARQRLYQKVLILDGLSERGGHVEWCIAPGPAVGENGRLFSVPLRFEAAPRRFSDAQPS